MNLIKKVLIFSPFILLLPTTAFLKDFNKLQNSEKNKIFQYVSKNLKKNDETLLINSAYPYNLYDVKNDLEESLLHKAVLDNLVDVVPMLIRNNISIDSITVAGITPLQMAIFRKNSPMVKLLVESGANINKKNNTGQTPLLVATMVKNQEIIDFLLEKNANINMADKNGITPVIQAIIDKNIPLIDLYISKKANINTRTDLRKTPLHFAVQTNNYEIVQKLLEAGANINARDYDIISPNTPLDLLQKQKDIISVSNNTKNIEELLIDKGAKHAKPYYNSNFSLSAFYLFASPFDERVFGTEFKTPVRIHYTGINARYYIAHDLSLSWSYAYGIAQNYSNKKLFMAPAGLLGLQSLFSFLQTDYDTQLHGPAKGLYYALLGISAFLPEGISWDLHLPSSPNMSFSIQLDWAKAHYIMPATKDSDPFSLQLTGEIQGRLNFLIAEHWLMGVHLNVGFSYTQLEFVWGVGASIGALF